MQFSTKNLKFKRINLFLYKLLNHSVDSLELLAEIPLCIRHYTVRSTNTFYVQRQKQNYSHFAILNRILLNGNLTKNFDFFYRFTNKVKKYLFNNCLY